MLKLFASEMIRSRSATKRRTCTSNYRNPKLPPNRKAAYKIEALTDPSASEKSLDSNEPFEVCAACGEEFFGPDAETSSWRSWSTFWKIMGMSNVELVCGACGEYLSRIFRADEK